MEENPKERIGTLIPAYNEERHIALVLEPTAEARKREIVDDVIVLDDGSTDRTGEIARAFNIEVVRNPTNIGKTNSLIKGIRILAGRGMDIVFTTDADMLNLTTKIIERFLGNIRGRREVSMIRSEYEQYPRSVEIEDWDESLAFCPPDMSGFRAIRMRVLKPLLEGMALTEQGSEPQTAISRKFMQYLSIGGMSFEYALEQAITSGKIEVRGLNLKSRERGRGSTPLEQINRDFNRVYELINKRNQIATAARTLRRLKDQTPEHPLVTGKTNRETLKMAETLPAEQIEEIRRGLAQTKPAKPTEKQTQ